MKLIIDINENDYELLSKAQIILDLHVAYHGKEIDRKLTFAVFDLVKALKEGTPYKEME